MIEENKNDFISYWLLLITFLVVTMIVVGGLTRLTDSGLSITKWDLFIGILPPFTLKEWKYTFSLYQQIPEFKLINSSMTLSEFKIIYWWEYIHRLLGRIIGIFYLLPLIFFTFKNKLRKRKLFVFYSIFFLICFQGFIGWYMVKSGLSERTDVSHYRLSIHLTLAFIILILLIWNYLKINNKSNVLVKSTLPIYLSFIFLFLILLQISIGALVSGLDAGQIYQTWPLMNQSYYPDDSTIRDLFTLDIFESPSIVQFIHRNLAYLIIIFFLIIAFLILKNNNFNHLRKTMLIVFIALIFQILLGIFTVISGAQILLASLHQIGSVFLVTTSLVLTFKDSNFNQPL